MCVPRVRMAEWLLRASDQWDVQATIKRVNESLIARGYVTWFDLTNMKGEYSTDDTAAAAAAAATDATDAIPPSKDVVCVMRGHDAGSTVDAMSDAIEGADVMLYGVSLKYKESANVRIAHGMA